MDSDILIYQTESGDTKVEVRLENESVWLNKAQMSELYQCDRSSISKHIKNIYETGELDPNTTCANFAQVRLEGQRNVQRELDFYNLDVIISVGYRVNSHRGTQFRMWATQRLREYIIKGFVLDDERLKSAGQRNYFDELLERIRDIRSSEKVLYLKIRDIFATSIDYDPKSESAQKFFAKMQNKLHWAVSKSTGAEIIYNRVDAEQRDLGMTNWSGKRITKADVTVAKNYLKEDELKQLNLLVEQYLAFAESQALTQKPMYMADWEKKLNDILTLNDREILENAGTISRQLAESKAHKEFEKYAARLRELNNAEEIKELENELKIFKNKGKA